MTTAIDNTNGTTTLTPAGPAPTNGHRKAAKTTKTYRAMLALAALLKAGPIRAGRAKKFLQGQGFAVTLTDVAARNLGVVRDIGTENGLLASTWSLPPDFVMPAPKEDRRGRPKGIGSVGAKTSASRRVARVLTRVLAGAMGEFAHSAAAAGEDFAKVEPAARGRFVAAVRALAYAGARAFLSAADIEACGSVPKLAAFLVEKNAAPE